MRTRLKKPQPRRIVCSITAVPSSPTCRRLDPTPARDDERRKAHSTAQAPFEPDGDRRVADEIDIAGTKRCERDSAYVFQCCIAALSSARTSTQRSPAGVSSLFQNGASVLSQSIRKWHAA